ALEQMWVGAQHAALLHPPFQRAYVTRSNRGFGRYDLPTFAHGFPSSITTSAVKSNRPWNRLEPTPYASTAPPCSSTCRLLSTVKPPETTIRTFLKPYRSTALP